MRAISVILTALFIWVAPFTLAKAATPPGTDNSIIPPGSLYTHITSLKVKDIQKAIGRKLTIKERIGLLFLKKQVKRKAGESSKQGQASFILGLASVALLAGALILWGPLLVGAIITSILAIVFGSMAKKDNPNDKKALAGRLMGWITLGLIVILIIAVIAALDNIFN
jgi:hypothetical protein